MVAEEGKLNNLQILALKPLKDIEAALILLLKTCDEEACREDLAKRSMRALGEILCFINHAI